MDLTTLMKKSEKRILTLHPSLQSIAFELIKLCYKEGIYILITQGLRTMAEQQALYNQGRISKCTLCAQAYTSCKHIVTNAKPGTSYHNYGCAFDFAVYSNDACTQINWTVDSKWMRVGAIGESLNLAWGGRWDFKDYPHFQIKGYTLADLKAGKRPSVPSVKKEEDYVMKKEDADKLIALMGAMWNFAESKQDKDEAHRLANELRKASGQKVG